MSVCPFKETCMSHKDIYNNFPSKFVRLIEEYYCTKNSKKCARYLVGTHLGKENIPISLKPNDLTIARQIIK